MKEYMTLNEMEDYFKVSKRTIFNWRQEGLEVVKIGKLVYFPADSVKEFFDQRKTREDYLYD